MGRSPLSKRQRDRSSRNPQVRGNFKPRPYPFGPGSFGGGGATAAGAYRGRYKRIVLSGRLDLEQDPEGTLSQFEKLWQVAKRGMRPPNIRIDMTQVSHIDAPSLLMFAAAYDAIRESARLERIQGLYPASPRIRGMLEEADFTGFVTNQKNRVRTDACLRLRHGRQEGTLKELMRDVSMEIRAFIMSKNEALSLPDCQTAYSSVFECLENVSLHAFGKDGDGVHQKEKRDWYVVGLTDSKENRVSIAIMDLGVGIAATVQRSLNRWESVFRKFPLINSSRGVSDLDLVVAATLGDRKESGDEKHGKGLSHMREYAQENRHCSLHVYSSGSIVRWSSDEEPIRARLQGLHGTIVCITMAP